MGTQQNIIVQIAVPQDVYEVLEEHIKDFQKPPRLGDKGETIIERRFETVADYLSQILAVNVGKVLEERPTPRVKGLRDEIEQRQEQIRDLVKPGVRVEHAPNLGKRGGQPSGGQ